MKAHVRHILVETQAAADDLARRLREGEDFADLAREHSQCPSAEQGGDLGELTPGEMVREFDNVVFFGEVGPVHGPVKSPLGYHLIEILERTD
jgi:peptidyl-prolyl cis-trans isomerase C